MGKIEITYRQAFYNELWFEHIDEGKQHDTGKFLMSFTQQEY